MLLRLVLLSAGKVCATVHALSRLSHFPHVLVAPAYMRFRAYPIFRMYYFCRRTCTFRLVMISARTIPTGLHVVSGLSRFPHVLFLPEYMHFSACHDFRTYNSHGLACGFWLVTLSAHTIPAGVHALSRLSCLSHVLFLSGYMRFSACHNFCTYNSHGLACGFQLVTFSARTISAGVHALSRLSCLSHVLFLPVYMRFHACPTFHR